MKLVKSLVELVHNRAINGLMTTIITYNFDDYFEFAYKCLYPKDYEKHLKSYNMIEPRHLPTGIETNPVNIYHVHGRICIFDELYGYQIKGCSMQSYIEANYKTYYQDLKEGIIFSGNDYGTLMDDKVVGWTNMIQYICYSQLELIIIGFSMTDVNFRLLLRRMRKSNEKIKKITFYLGYSESVEGDINKAEGNKQIIEYLLQGLCNELKCNLVQFSNISDEIKKII